MEKNDPLFYLGGAMFAAAIAARGDVIAAAILLALLGALFYDREIRVSDSD